MQTRQNKSHSPNTAPTKTAEAPQKAAVSAASASRVPAWTGGMNDQIPPGLVLQDASAISGIQAKLAISQPNDPYEQEADRVAEQVMRMPGSPATVQRKCACGGIAGQTGECEACAAKRKVLQRRATQSVTESTAPPIVNQVLSSGNGQPLDAGTRALMEPRFGQDFSSVQVHTDGQAAESAQSVSALAYTVGNDVVFGSGQYRPETGEGKKLLAHELTHVVQQVPHLARDLSVGKTVTCALEHQEGEGQKTKAVEELARDIGTEDVYIIWGTWQKTDTVKSFWEHVYQNWIRWRFGTLPLAAYTHLAGILANARIRPFAQPLQPGCQYHLMFPLDQISQLILIATREKAGQAAQEREAQAGLPLPPGKGNQTAGGGNLPPTSPPQGGKEAKGTTTTEQKEEGKAVPRTGSEFTGGTDEKANAPALPAKISGPDKQVTRGTGTYRMQLEYWPAGYDRLSQVVEAMNWVDYHWERFNITELIKQGMSQKQVEEERKQKAVSSEAEAGRFEGTKRSAERSVEDIAEDAKNSAHDLAHPVDASTTGTAGDVLTKALANYENLELLPASAIVSLGGVALGALADLMGRDFQERELVWPGEGYYFIRCIAHPAPQGKQQRASSVATKIVEVQSAHRLATETLDEPEAIEAELKLQLLQEQDLNRRKKIEQQLADQPILARGSALEVLELRIKRKTEERDKATGERRKQLEDELGALNKQLGFAKEFHGLIGNEVRPRATFASRVTGETYPLLLQLGALPNEGSQFRCQVSDVSGPKRDTYEGRGSTPSAAVWNAFRNFAGHNEYGRGTLVVRLPDAVDTAFGQDKVITPKEQPFDNVQRDTALVKQRLSDLVTILVILGLFVPGVGEIAAVVGAALAAEHLIERWQRGTLSFDAQTVTDIIAILGAVGQGAALIGKLQVVRSAEGVALAAAGADEVALQKALGAWAQAAKVMRTIELANKVVNYGGLIWGDLVVVNQIMEINQLELNNKITHAEARRKRAELLASAIRDNGLQFAQAMHRPAEAAPAVPTTGHAGGKPAEPTTPTKSTESKPTEPVPVGHPEGKPTELTKPQQGHAGAGQEQKERPGGDTVDPSRATPGQGGPGGELPLTGQEKVRASAPTPDGLHKIIILDDGRIIRCQTCAEIRAHYESFLGNETDTARKQQADDFKQSLDKLEASTKATTDPAALQKLAEQTAALDVQIRKFAAERLTTELGLTTKRTPGVETLLGMMTPDEVRALHKQLTGVKADLFSWLTGRSDPNVIEKFVESMQLMSGDKVAQDELIHTLELGSRGSVSEKNIGQAFADLVKFMQTYQGRVSGDFVSRFRRVIATDITQAQAEIDFARDILEGKTPLGQGPKVEGLPETGVARIPEYRISLPDGTTTVVEVKKIQPPLHENNLRRNLRSALGQLSTETQRTGEKGALLRLDASGKGQSALTDDQIRNIIQGQWRDSGTDAVSWIEVLYADAAGSSRRLLLKVQGGTLSTVP